MNSQRHIKMQKAPKKGLKAICHYVLKSTGGTDETRLNYNNTLLLHLNNTFNFSEDRMRTIYVPSQIHVIKINARMVWFIWCMV